MKKQTFGPFRILSTVVLASVVAFNVYEYINKPRIAYVRSHDLIEKYMGTREARSVFEKKKSTMMANVDSLRLDFERARNQYISGAGRLTTQERTQQEKMLGQQQSQLVQYSEAVGQKIEEEDNKMMQEVLNQINSFVENYAQEEHYDIIMGTTLSGSLLYGEKSMDITDHLLEQLNNKYKGK